MSASKNFPTIPKDWKVSQESVYTDSHQIAVKVWQASQKQNSRVLIIVHGQGEQSNRYEHFPHYLKQNVDTIVTFDLPGHGLTTRHEAKDQKKDRGHVESFDEYKLAFKAVYDWSKSHFAQNEIFVLGHSLGGLITLYSLLNLEPLDIRKVIVSAPLLDLAMPVPKLKKFFGELLEPLISRLPMSNEIDAANVSKDSSVVAEYKEDPLNHGMVTPRFFVQMTKARESVLKNHIFTYDLAIIVPLEDKLVSSKATIGWFKKLEMGNLKKDIFMFPGFYHESFNELAKERAFSALNFWIQGGRNP